MEVIFDTLGQSNELSNKDTENKSIAISDLKRVILKCKDGPEKVTFHIMERKNYTQAKE